MATYVELIGQLKELIELNQDMAFKFNGLAADTRYSTRDREASRALGELGALQVGRLKTLASTIATLGMANSTEPFDKILEALGK